MNAKTDKLVVFAVVAELVLVGITAAPASAQESSREIRRQQRIIQEQQQQIQEYRRALAARQQQPAQEESGFLLGCPRGYTYSYFGGGCLPNLPAQVVVTPGR